MGQDKVVGRLEQHQPIPQARFALTQGVDPAPDRRHALANIEVEPVTVDRRIAPPTAASERRV